MEPVLGSLRRSLLFLFACGLAAGGPVHVAAAQGGAVIDDRSDEEGRMRFELGRRYYDEGRFAEAAVEFERAYAASGREALLYNIFLARRDAGDLREARDALERYIAAGAPEGEALDLEARARELEAQLADEDFVDDDADPSGFEPWPPILLASGGALLLASVVTGVLAQGEKATLDDEFCTAGMLRCDSGFEEVADRGQTLAVATDVLWVGGAAIAITGLVLLVLSLVSDESDASTAHCGAGTCGIGVAF